MRNPRSQNRTGWIALALLLAIASTAAVVSAQEAGVDQLVEKGRVSYLAHCASCHGNDARGSGIIAPYLKIHPSDLTQIASRNQGAFPFDLVFDIVEGREIPGHGTRAMPVWGPAFTGLDPEANKTSVKEQVAELVYFLKSIQPVLPVAPVKMGGADH